MTRVLIVHRRYRLRGGEDTFIEDVLVRQLIRQGYEIQTLILDPLFKGRSFRSRFVDFIELVFMALGLETLRPSCGAVKSAVANFKPTHVVFNNFIPTISLRAPAAARALGPTTLAWVHNARLSCANGLLFNGRRACHECFTVGSRRAFRYSCLGSRVQSALYAWNYRSRRVSRLVAPSIDRFVAVSEYSARGVNSVLDSISGAHAKVNVVRGAPVIDEPSNSHSAGEISRPERFAEIDRPFYVFVGRVSHEKGADVFAAMAKEFKDFLFVLCGTGPLLEKIGEHKPKNLLAVGFAGVEEKNWLYANARALIIPSRVPENAPMTIIESQEFGTPVIYPRGGGAEEAVRALGRGGCALDEFRGQDIDRAKKISPQQMRADFENKIKEIFES